MFQPSKLGSNASSASSSTDVAFCTVKQKATREGQRIRWFGNDVL